MVVPVRWCWLRTIMIGALVIVGCAATVAGTDYQGLVSVDSVNVVPGQHFAVSVRFSNSNIPFSALQVPLIFEGAWVDVDSVSFVGCVKPHNMDAHARIDNKHDSVHIVYLPWIMDPIPRISASEGIIATVYFTTEIATPTQTARIDSVNHDAGDSTLHIWTRVNISDTLGVIYLPDFEHGAIHIQGSLDVDDDGPAGGLPSTFGLHQNFPNPFNPVTRIGFSVPYHSRVRLEVFNILGQSTAVLADGYYSAGEHQIEFDAAGQPSGIYFYRLTHDDGSWTKKMVVLK